ncbi:MAG: LPS export ABC transporter periplasmic protein LptC [Candidatus Poribacteria bacterium]|nr:LPS export ABC transporter periplasmic protein LptC [Candidatus Poribacteria bacterium]
MIRKKIIPKMNSDISWKLPQVVRNLFVFLCTVICLITFSVVADEAPNTEKKEGEVVQQSEEKPADSVKSVENKNAKKDSDTPSPDSDGTATKPTKEVIVGDSDEADRNIKTGITILIGNVKTIRLNEQGIEIGFLNADKVTLKTDTKTGQTTEIIAVGNVEIRDQDIFATCDHATMNNLTNIITLKDNVVVLQNKDRLETKLFTFNRTTGEQKGVGNVKFKVTVTQATPTATPEESEEAGTESKDTSATTDKTDEKAASEELKKETEKKSDSEKTDNKEKNTPSETDSESKKDKETEPAESEETEPTKSEETDETEGSEETE